MSIMKPINRFEAKPTPGFYCYSTQVFKNLTASSKQSRKLHLEHVLIMMNFTITL